MDEMSVPSRSTVKASIIGKPGAGKTTQADLLASTLGIKHISSGDLVRAHANEHTKAELALGHMDPDEGKVRAIVKEAISSLSEYILDGFPRWLDQTQSLNDIPINVVLHLDVADEISVARLLARGRPDDTKDVIEERLRVYYDKTHPLLSYFSNRDIPVLYIDGSLSIGHVWASIMDSLNGLQD